jgi:alkylation response protein AidB-like acyl-CoA dehydrogenase
MTTAISIEATTNRTDWVAVARELGPGFASRAPALDANDSFAADNYRELKEQRVFSSGVPAELGGGGASHAELCAMLRELGRHCGATALALSMHTHLVAANVWGYHQGEPVAPLLKRIAAEELVLVTSGSGDWLDSSGTATRVDGGYQVTASKHFVSGSIAGDVFMSTAIFEDPNDGPTVLHFSIPMKTVGVTILENWRTMAMRASGSNDLMLDSVFVPESAVGSRRPPGAWPPFFDVVVAVADPLIMSVYLGVAEAARDLAVERVAMRRDDQDLWYLVGEMENALVTGELAVQSMVDLCANYTFQPGVTTTNAFMIRKTIAAESLLLAVEKALETVGGSGIFRSVGLERLVRDIHAAQFHPLPTKRQQRFTGRVTLGLDAVG